MLDLRELARLLYDVMMDDDDASLCADRLIVNECGMNDDRLTRTKWTPERHPL